MRRFAPSQADLFAAAATMAEERRALGLARLAGPEGEQLAAAILQETERLLTAAEQDAHTD